MQTPTEITEMLRIHSSVLRRFAQLQDFLARVLNSLSLTALSWLSKKDYKLSSCDSVIFLLRFRKIFQRFFIFLLQRLLLSLFIGDFLR